MPNSLSNMNHFYFKIVPTKCSNCKLFLNTIFGMVFKSLLAKRPMFFISAIKEVESLERECFS